MGSITLHEMNGVFTLTLDNSSSANSIDPQMARELAEATDLVQSTSAARGLIITGAGDSYFCSGGDLRSYLDPTWSTDEVRTQFELMRSTCDRIRSLHIFTVAAVNGAAVGGGAELMLACDMRVARPTAIIQFPQVRLGLATGWGGHIGLVSAVGRSQALELLLSARTVTGSEALAMGMVTELGLDPQGRAKSLVDEVTQDGNLAVAIVKQLVSSTSQSAEATQAEIDLFMGLWPPRRDMLPPRVARAVQA